MPLLLAATIVDPLAIVLVLPAAHSILSLLFPIEVLLIESFWVSVFSHALTHCQFNPMFFKPFDKVTLVPICLDFEWLIVVTI